MPIFTLFIGKRDGIKECSDFYSQILWHSMKKILKGSFQKAREDKLKELDPLAKLELEVKLLKETTNSLDINDHIFYLRKFFCFFFWKKSLVFLCDI